MEKKQLLSSLGTNNKINQHFFFPTEHMAFQLQASAKQLRCLLVSKY